MVTLVCVARCLCHTMRDLLVRPCTVTTELHKARESVAPYLFSVASQKYSPNQTPLPVTGF